METKNKTMNQTVDYNGYELEVYYTFIKGFPSNYEYPGDKDTIEIDAIMCDGLDLTPLIEMIPNALEEIEIEILDKL